VVGIVVLSVLGAMVAGPWLLHHSAIDALRADGVIPTLGTSGASTAPGGTDPGAPDASRTTDPGTDANSPGPTPSAPGSGNSADKGKAGTATAPSAKSSNAASASPTSRSTRSSRGKRPSPAPTATTPVSGSTAEAQQVLTLVNAERTKAGCSPVVLNAQLTQAALGHSKDMAAQNFFSHTSKDGRTFVDRIRATGYDAARSENIATGQKTPAEVMTSWINSSGHQANILDCSAKAMGVGVARSDTGGVYWTQDFGTAA
jgi:uncharacterized protein YkwD